MLHAVTLALLLLAPVAWARSCQGDRATFGSLQPPCGPGDECPYTCSSDVFSVSYFCNRLRGTYSDVNFNLLASAVCSECGACTNPPTPFPTFSPPTPEVTPGGDAVTLQLTAGGIVSDFDSSKRLSLKTTVANSVNRIYYSIDAMGFTTLKASDVTLSIVPGSVVMTFTIYSPLGTAANVQNNLARSMPTSEAASTILGISVTQDPIITRLSTGEGGGTGGGKRKSAPPALPIGAVAGAGAGGALLILGIGVFYFFFRRRRKLGAAERRGVQMASAPTTELHVPELTSPTSRVDLKKGGSAQAVPVVVEDHHSV